ncbi:MAG: ABC transporter permease [Bacilli bacterium]|nr:ABC transporter permease [Bacilli bacterium]
MNSNNLANKNIQQDDRFTFAHENVELHDHKLETKARGYFADAFFRFRRNKASVTATFIIGIILLFALLVPMLTPKPVRTLMDPYYSKKGPRSAMFYDLGLNGGQTKTLTDRVLYWEYSKGVAAEFTEEKPVISVEESKGTYYQPVISYKPVKGADYLASGNRYAADVDQYLSVGFKYISIEQSKFQEFRDWEEEHNVKLLYPLIADNEYTFGANTAEAANYWYKATNRNDPVKIVAGNPVPIPYAQDMVFEDNYMRDGAGNFVYRVHTGGGSFETAQFKVRVLYYNYYRYMYDREPNYLFGTDSQGYSMIYRLSTGVRLSLMIAVLVSTINFIIGALYGAVEGYYGGATDLVMERIGDILAGVPFVVVVTLFQLHLAAKVGSFVGLLFAYVTTGWLGTAASVRTQFYRYKNQEYVLAARTLGASDRRIMWKHIFPNTLGTIITSSVLVIPGVIFSESMLSYLGIIKLGGATTTSLGTLLSDASSIWTSYPSLMIFPALIISLLMICFNLFGNGLRDAFNPQLRGSDS